MLILSIDGATRANGQPECSTCGMVFAHDTELNSYDELPVYELQGSTNQRGEINGLIRALEFIDEHTDDNPLIITDSEYVYNSMTKLWFVNWKRKGWIKSDNEPVKNQDLWDKVHALWETMDFENISIVHTKGHIMSVGKVAFRELYDKEDRVFQDIVDMVTDKLEKDLAFPESTPRKRYEKALGTFERINKFKPDEGMFKRVIVFNQIADMLAGLKLDRILNSDEEQVVNAQLSAALKNFLRP